MGLCFPIIVIITAFSNLFGSGGAPLFSINKGKGNIKKAELKVRVLSKGEWKACREDAKNIVSLGSAGFIMQLTNSLVTICCNSVLSGIGGDVYISVMTIVSSIRQMVETPIYAIKVFIVVPLTYLFPYAFHMGTKGVFLAEPISNVIGGSLCFITMLVMLKRSI